MRIFCRSMPGRTESTLLSAEHRRALAHLHAANRSAVELGRPALDFACQLPNFETMHVSDVTLRWLVCKGLIAHYLETTRRDQDLRTFRPAPNLRFTDASCFVITSRGLIEAEGLSEGPQHRQDKGDSIAFHVPHWDAARRELRLGFSIIKQFKVPAANQESILNAFEEESWPAHIYEPLPPHAGLDPKRRLHDTIDRLNRNQRQLLLRFHGDGYGTGVWWEALHFVADRPPTDRR